MREGSGHNVSAPLSGERAATRVEAGDGKGCARKSSLFFLTGEGPPQSGIGPRSGSRGLGMSSTPSVLSGTHPIPLENPVDNAFLTFLLGVFLEGSDCT